MSAIFNNIANAALPTTVAMVDVDRKMIKAAFRTAGVPSKLVTGIETRALKSQRRQTGSFQSNRRSRWELEPGDPQIGTELDSKIIQLRLMGMLLQFEGAPTITPPAQNLLETRYLGSPIVPGSYRDSLLLEQMSYAQFVGETLAPIHGTSNFHLGHEDPTLIPKHKPENIAWRSHRSNLIQGNMTLRQARIYILKLIGRYFELGELDLT